MAGGRLFSSEDAERLGLHSEPTVPEGGENPGGEAGQGQIESNEAPPAGEAPQGGEKPQAGVTPEGTEAGGEGQPTASPFDIKTFNTIFEKDFKTEDDIKSLFERVDKYSDYDEKVNKLSEFESVLAEKEKVLTELKEAQDPLKWFPSEKAFRAAMLQKQFPDKDPNILSRVITGDLTKVKNLDVLVDSLLLDTPSLEGDRSRAKAILYRRYGIDIEETPNEEDWDQVTRDIILTDADIKRREFNKLADGVEIPKVVTSEEKAAAQKQQLDEIKASWVKPINSIAQYDKEVIADAKGETLVEFEVPQEFKAGIKDYVSTIVNNGLPLTKENLDFVESQVRKGMVYDNLPKILAAYKGQLESEWQKQKDIEDGNVTPPNTQIAPDIADMPKGGVKEALRGGKF